MPLYFTLNTSNAELDVPAGAVLVVDPEQRELVKGETFAFRDADGDYFFARITSTGRARKTVVNRDKCTIIGRVVSWTAETRPVLH